MSLRPIKRLIKSKPTVEGAGVHLRRAFGFGNTSEFDPFLLLDDFRNDVPEDYLAGFPWHPHRGIETITYVLAGTVEHGDSMGNQRRHRGGRHPVDDGGARHHSSGDAQGRRRGPHARLSAVGEPAVVAEDDRAALSGSESRRKFRRSPTTTAREVRIVCGTFLGKDGARWRAWPPIRFISTSRCRRASGRACRSRRRGMRSRTCSRARQVLQRVRSAGSADRRRGLAGYDASDGRRKIGRSCCSISGDEVTVQAGDNGIRFLLVSGKPLEEPVAWYGPIVMNTQDELRRAFEELQEGTFLKS